MALILADRERPGGVSIATQRVERTQYRRPSPAVLALIENETVALIEVTYGTAPSLRGSYFSSGGLNWIALSFRRSIHSFIHRYRRRSRDSLSEKGDGTFTTFLTPPRRSVPRSQRRSDGYVAERRSTRNFHHTTQQTKLLNLAPEPAERGNAPRNTHKQAPNAGKGRSTFSGKLR